MFQHLCLALIPSILWAITVTIEKFYLLDYFTSYELRFSNTLIMIIPLMIFLNYDRKYRKKIINIPKKKILFLLLRVLLAFIAGCVFLYLLKNNKTFLTVSIVQPMFIVFSILFAYLFFNETINFKQIVGISMVIIGIFIISFNKTTLKK
jgi:uncharacterized membrane protein